MSAQFDVRYVAQLARLNLSEEEIAKFRDQLAQVLEHGDKLSQVDVTSIEPTAHANAVNNPFRPDEARDWFSAEQALSDAPRAANHLLIVPKVIE